MPFRRIVLLALALGVLGGVVIALAVPKTRERPLARATTAAPATPSIASARRRSGEIILRRVPGTARIEYRHADPRGGAPWALRVFNAQRITPPSQRRRGVDPVLGRNLCVQLGRIVQGRFGWIDATNTFRPVGFLFRGAPILCGSRVPDRRRQPQLQVLTLISDPARADAEPLQTVVFGIAGPTTRGVALRLGDERARAPLSRRGAFLAFASPEIGEESVEATFTYKSGPPKRLDPARDLERRFAALSRFPALPKPQRATAIIVARAPDPSGGLPWGLAGVRSTSGRWCVSQEGRIVGNRVGRVHYELGTFQTHALSPFDCQGPTSANPVELRSSHGVGRGEEGADPGRGRILRRTLPAATVLYGAMRADVRSVTIATPRDVRTLIPSPIGRAFLAVYDGTFPTGEFVVTATLVNGRAVVQRFPGGY